MKYLADTSALVRIQRNQAPPDWDDVIERGLVAICEPVLAEMMRLANAKVYPAVEDAIFRLYPRAVIPDDIWATVSAIRRELVEPSAYHGLSVADLVIAATATRLELTVLHEDVDFETIARHVPEFRQHRVSTPPE
ncbi:PIN domain-containing protein [Dactylosporangium sp. NPDC048998]|uniref:PIN domain-containing protein n=1 Tax=Dactylosporangium sp. NPDC048998 TaxID=3363976 RepID=UPI003719B523